MRGAYLMGRMVRGIVRMFWWASLLSGSLFAQTELITVSVRSTFNAGQAVETIALSADGKTGAVGTKSGQVGIIDLGAGNPPRWLARHKKRVNVLAFNRAGTLLASAGDDGTVDLISIPGGQTKELNGHRRKVWALAFSPEGQFLTSGGDDKEIIVWDSTSGAELYRLMRDSNKAIIFLGFNGSGTKLLAADETGVISEWDVKNRARLRQQSDSDKTFYSAAGSFSGNYLVVGTEFSTPQKGAALKGTIRPTDLYRESRVKLYDTDKLEVTKTIDNINGEVSSISISADNRYVAISRQRISDSYLSVYDILRGIEVTSFPGNGDLKAVAFSPDGQSLASGNEMGEVRVYEIKGIRPGREVGDIRGMKFKVNSSQASPLIPKNANLIVGVVDFDANGVDTGTANEVADQLRTRIAASGSVTLVERSKMEQIIHEQNFQASNRTDPATATRLGHLLGARKIIFGSVGKLGTSLTIHTEVVDVETGKVDGSSEIICQQCAGEDLPEAVAALEHYLIDDSH